MSKKGMGSPCCRGMMERYLNQTGNEDENEVHTRGENLKELGNFPFTRTEGDRIVNLNGGMAEWFKAAVLKTAG